MTNLLKAPSFVGCVWQPEGYSALHFHNLRATLTMQTDNMFTAPKDYTMKFLALSVIALAMTCLSTLKASSQNFGEEVLPTISFSEDFRNVNENAETVLISVDIFGALETDAQFTIEALSISSAVEDEDYDFEGTTFTIPQGHIGPFSFPLNISENDDTVIEDFLTLRITGALSAFIGDNNTITLFIQESEEIVVEKNGDIQLNYVSSFLVDESGSAEIVSHDAGMQRLYVLNSDAPAVHILDFSNPNSLSEIAVIDMSGFGEGATSIEVNNGVVAATIDGLEGENGKVVFLDLDGNIVSSVTVGALPDMLVFTPDGNSVLVANEGEPNDDYTIDPEGTISRIDISGGVKNLTDDNVVTIDFNAFDDQIETLRAAGVRIFGFETSVSRDLEPEYITVSEDSQTGWVTLQENNAVAVIDLNTNQISDILPLGKKDYSLEQNALDASDRSDEIFFHNWPVKGMFQPDAIASYQLDGVTYLVTANEGDQREFGPIDEDVDINTDEYVLDPTVFPHADVLKNDPVLGRLACSPYSGDIDGDGDFDEIHVFGSRSFSIWNGTTGELVFDSGSDFERITANDPVYGALFNASNSNNNFKNRSDNKGPEPEGVTVAEINGRNYAFITLERVGGVMTYDVTDPANAFFVDYDNNRTLGEDDGGDLGPEGIIYISSADSPNGHGMVIMANEVSATLSIYTVDPSACYLADLDVDGVVDAADLLIMLANFGCEENCLVGDFNNDDVVSIADLLIFLSGYGETCN